MILVHVVPGKNIRNAAAGGSNYLIHSTFPPVELVYTIDFSIKIPKKLVPWHENST